MGQYCNTGEKCAYLWSPQRTIEVKEFSPYVTMQVSPLRINGPGDVDILFTATNPDGSARQGLEINVGAAAGGLPIGSFVGYTGNPVNGTTGPDGLLSMTLHLDSIADEVVITGTFDDDCPVVGVRTLTRKVRYIERPPWIQPGVSVGWSCPLVADLTGDGIPEVAVIARDRVDYTSETYSGISDGRIYIWDADGNQLWVSSETVDKSGDNTLSAADILGTGTLEFTAPANGAQHYDNKVYAFGYDGGFKPLAGWPTRTKSWYFSKAAAAIGDANLDGTCEVVAADYSCFVYSWNATGNWNPSGNSFLWEQITGGPLTSIENSSVALGDVNSFADSSRIPEAVVGSYYIYSELFAFPGNEWGSLISNPSYPAQWPPKDTAQNIESSPAISLIDGDDENDVVVGDDSGKLYVWLSSNRQWISRQLAYSPIKSSPTIVEIDGQRRVIVGCDNGYVYSIYWNGSSLADCVGWTNGILLAEGKSVRTSSVVGDVMNTGEPQIVVGCMDGKVYALWADGTNHLGGPIAKSWTCAQYEDTKILSTPTICSLDGTQVSMIVGSTDGIYKLDRIRFHKVRYLRQIAPDGHGRLFIATMHAPAARQLLPNLYPPLS